MIRFASLLAFAVAMIFPQTMPPDLAALARKARLASPVVAWCAGEFREGRPGAYAVAVTSAARGGRDLVLESDATVTTLAAFTGPPGLACYTPEEARKLDVTIKESETIEGGIAPRWSTTVVCGFLDDTSAACWQYAPDDRAFARVGAWVT